MALMVESGVTWVLVAVIGMLLATLAQTHGADVPTKTHKLSWTVETTNVTRNCVSVSIPTVNGRYPGPTVEINEGDTVVITVTNKANYEVSIHWHGIFQFLTNWADGPAHITQCPLPIGDSQIYEFTVTGQSGTFWWHAHNNWLRATVFGAFIVHPKETPPYGKVAGEFSILSGDWFTQDPNIIEREQVIDTRILPNDMPSALTINGQPGPMYGCSSDENSQKFEVTRGSKYLFRLTNVGLNSYHFFQVANHTLTVVAADGNYLKPFKADVVVITPGQTTDVLLTANYSSGSFYCGVSLAEQSGVPGSSTTTFPALALIEYKEGLFSDSGADDIPVMEPLFPMAIDASPKDLYLSKLRGLAPYDLPETVDHELVFTIAIASVACGPQDTPNCTVSKFAGTVQNLTFDRPQNTSILEAYYAKTENVYTTDFPAIPPVFGDFTSARNTNYTDGSRGTRVHELEFNDTVQLVLQNVWAMAPAIDHPIHLHGHDFYVVGQNTSNYNPEVHPAYFNLVDPPKFNTFGLPPSGWVALRFRANNPGVWLLHCHFERHKTWGMEMSFITKNGADENEKLPGPKHPTAPCP